MRLFTLVALLVVVALPALAGPPTTSPAQQAKIDKLRDNALNSGNFPATQSALSALRSEGQPANAAIVDVVKQLLDRDATVIDRAVADLSDMQGLRAADESLTTLRPLALANIQKLDHDETLTKAHEYADKLIAAQAKINAALLGQDALNQIMTRRPQWVDLYRQRAPATATQSLSADEAKIRAAAQLALRGGANIPAIVDLTRPPKFNDAAYRAWFFRACRQIEEYNQTIGTKFSNAEEMEDVRALNAYREALGLMPLELDPRLVQSARLHSKEMVEKNYFAHESPTPSEKDPQTRITNSGYTWQGCGENIFESFPWEGGRAAFWQWFDSPGHHKNMASDGYIAVGVGRWKGHWTQNFGLGARLSLATDADRARAIARGKLPPDDSEPGAP